jgi:hypothetical protein
MSYYIAADTGEHFSVYNGFSVFGSVTEFTSVLEARTAFHASSYRAHGAYPRYFICNERTGKTVEEIQIFKETR